MSDTLADLASWLPSEFLSADDKPLFLNTHRFPYNDLASSSSTESDSDDDDIAGRLTRRFTRSVSLQDRIMKTPNYPPVERGFSGSPVSTLNCNVYGPTQSRSSPTTPFVQPEEDAWDLIYAAAGQVARMKMKASNVNGGVFGNRIVLEASRPPGPPLTHNQHHPNCAISRSEGEEFIRQQQLRLRFSGYDNYGCGGRCRPVGFRQTAWPHVPVEHHRRQQPTANGCLVKHVTGGSCGGCGRRTAVVKRECAGTGVFLPRRYPNDLPAPKKKLPACPPAHLPRLAQSLNKNMDPINNGQPQPNIHGGFAPLYQLPPHALPHHLKRDELAEMVIARRNAVMLAQHRRSTTHLGVTEAQEVVLPHEWTY